MVIVSFFIFMFVPLILKELKEATTGIVIDSLSEEQKYLFEEIRKNTKESIIISAKPFVLKQEIISTREQIEAWEKLLLGIGNSLNRQYGLIRIMTFDLSGRMINDYGIDDNMPRFDPQQQLIQKIITQCLETESSSESVVASLKNSPYWGLCLLSEGRDEEVSNAHLFILDYKKILQKMKKSTGTDVAIQIGNNITHNNLGKKFIDGIIKNEKTFVTTDSEGKEQHYIIAKSALINRHILTKNVELNKLIFFINSEKIHTSFQVIASNLKFIILLITALSSLLLLAAIHYLLRPMKGVTKIAEAVSNGDYNVRLNHKSRDEIGTVMNTIDNMLDKIQQNYITIKREKENAEAAEIALEKSQSTIIQQEKMASVGQLAGGIAHDFNNILSVITGYSELALKDMKEDSPLKKYISTIHAAGEKAVSLTKELLAFSRKQPLEMKPSNINTTLDNMKNILTRLIGENIRLNIIKNKDLKNVLGDKTQMEQVVMNLVVNARDAMLNGGDLIIKTFNVYFRKGFNIGNEHIEPGPYAVLSVRDTGVGMSEEVQESIFEPFFSTKAIGKGTGMGLATVYGIVKQHGGFITVHSKLRKGTVFKVYVPSTDKDIEEDITIHTNVLTGNETILVVDDEPLLSGLVVEMLEPLGYRVLVAFNGEEALKACSNFNGRIDLLLTDVIMPGMNGRELADEFITKRPETKVIYMSGYTDDVIAHHGVLEDSVVLVNKPIKRSIVTSKIREVLGTRAHQLDNQAADEKLNGLNILIADDNDDMRKLIQVYMKDYECTIDTAENGKIAVEKFKLGRYDLVLMDMQMPVMNGLTATGQIREWEDETGLGQTKIVALTGNAAQEEIDKCLLAGCSSHLAKPIKKDELVNALVSNISIIQNYVHRSEKIQEEDKEERFVAHVDTDFNDLIPEYLEERQNDISRMQEAIKVQDYETILILGHSIKGTGGGFGFDAITNIGANLENAAEAKDFEEVTRLVNELEEYIDNVEITYE
jgi:signal transduction histidine kinase/CheY-like chemotaxis protein